MDTLRSWWFWLTRGNAINWLAGLGSLAVLTGSLLLLTSCLHGAESARPGEGDPSDEPSAIAGSAGLGLPEYARK